MHMFGGVWNIHHRGKLENVIPLSLCVLVRLLHCLSTFDIHVTVHRDKFLIIKPTRCTNFSNLFLE